MLCRGVLACGLNHVTKYFYDSRGGMTKVTADYGTGNAKDTTYTLNANGAVTKQTLPSGHYNDYVYDDGGRVTSQTFKTSGGTTVDSYSYNYSPTGLPSYTTGYTRTENNGDVYTFVFDRMGRMKQEKKVDSTPATPIVGADHSVCPRVDTTVDPYNHMGNRSTMQQQGSGAGITAYTYSNTYDAIGRLTQVADSGRNYTATVTTDANGNVTRVQEAWTGAPNDWRSDFTYDYENRLKEIKGSTVIGAQVVTFQTVNYSYDGLGRRIKTQFGGSTWAHVWERCKLLGNIDITNPGTPVNGIPSIFEPDSCKPIASPQVQSSSTAVYYLVSDDGDPARRAYKSDGTAGDTSQGSKYGEYKLINSSGPVYSFFGPRGTQQSELFNWRSFTANANNVMNIGPAGVQDSLGSTMNFAGANEWAPKVGASNSFDFGSDSDFGNTTMGGYGSLGMDPTLEWGAGAEPPAPQQPGGCTACRGGQSSKWLGPGPFTLIPASMKSGDPPKSTVTRALKWIRCNFGGMQFCLAGASYRQMGRDAKIAVQCDIGFNRWLDYVATVHRLLLLMEAWLVYCWLALVHEYIEAMEELLWRIAAALHEAGQLPFVPIIGFIDANDAWTKYVQRTTAATDAYHKWELQMAHCQDYLKCSIMYLFDYLHYTCAAAYCASWNQYVLDAISCASRYDCPDPGEKLCDPGKPPPDPCIKSGPSECREAYKYFKDKCVKGAAQLGVEAMLHIILHTAAGSLFGRIGSTSNKPLL